MNTTLIDFIVQNIIFLKKDEHRYPIAVPRQNLIIQVEKQCSDID